MFQTRYIQKHMCKKSSISVYVGIVLFFDSDLGLFCRLMVVVVRAFVVGQKLALCLDNQGWQSHV